MPARAQEAAPLTAIEDTDDNSVLNDTIVVTTQRREQNIQDVPISITAIGGQAIKELNIQDAQRIVDFIPNLKAAGLGGAGGPPFFKIRGISFIDFVGCNHPSPRSGRSARMNLPTSFAGAPATSPLRETAPCPT